MRNRGEKKNELKFLRISFFSACGKTNLAMLRPMGIPGYKVECIGKSRKKNFFLKNDF